MRGTRGAVPGAGRHHRCGAGVSECSRARGCHRGRVSPGEPGSGDLLADMSARSAGAEAGGFTCATVRVPLDYQDPGGPKIKLAVVRHAATGRARRGVIFINPGGPGFSGTVLIPAFIGLVPRVLLRDYDIVSWDPRGVGASTAVQCFPNLDAENAFLGDDAYFPARPDRQAGYISRGATFGKVCKARNGALLRHVSTA